MLNIKIREGVGYNGTVEREATEKNKQADRQTE